MASKAEPCHGACNRPTGLQAASLLAIGAGACVAVVVALRAPTVLDQSVFASALAPTSVGHRASLRAPVARPPAADARYAARVPPTHVHPPGDRMPRHGLGARDAAVQSGGDRHAALLSLPASAWALPVAALAAFAGVVTAVRRSWRQERGARPGLLGGLAALSLTASPAHAAATDVQHLATIVPSEAHAAAQASPAYGTSAPAFQGLRYSDAPDVMAEASQRPPLAEPSLGAGTPVSAVRPIALVGDAAGTVSRFPSVAPEVPQKYTPPPIPPLPSIEDLRDLRVPRVEDIRAEMSRASQQVSLPRLPDLPYVDLKPLSRFLRHPPQLSETPELFTEVADVIDAEGYSAAQAKLAVKPLFTTFNAFFLPPFALMIFLPKWPGTQSLLRSPLVPGVASGLFLLELLSATRADYVLPDGAFDADRWQQAATYLLTQAVADPAFMRDFANSTPSYQAQDWLHVCAWDLIGARWIYLDGLEKAIWTSHSIFLCQAAGPVGWLSHAITSGVVGGARWTKGLLPKPKQDEGEADPVGFDEASDEAVL
uniref:Uncharacterized protein n=1 Tax=Eutreptiella gymnastica TaxID=73025 RepID=A0A7S4FKL0_9EUGL|eukprot:CAMPEP_0174321136 /NCGR_PEP_ID=MMETSP0810-20121108/10054_1 /TAXON_ID=73025 ORGANISM="Eutreptiella gymnastica-like, Strain CCMP1594" /NCGR_SAMPLE_ID=MMETSP0810 /ASSEMBLY_ACC=CAM_ASM_000659 /LENGTH=541 /DNA_ID=CAMNT_0015432359 /DNA_START=30 /DNA_END=1655 /DNA_ORIENTATION=-